MTDNDLHQSLLDGLTHYRDKRTTGDWTHFDLLHAAICEIEGRKTIDDEAASLRIEISRLRQRNASLEQIALYPDKAARISRDRLIGLRMTVMHGQNAILNEIDSVIDLPKIEAQCLDSRDDPEHAQ